jgi:hypothetical protein
MVRGESPAHLLDGFKAHERLRGTTWLEGPESAEADAAWTRVVRQAPGVRPA